MEIREIKKEDVRRVVDFMIQLDHESDFLMYEPSERDKYYEKHVKEFETFSRSDNRTILLAIERNSIVGYILIVQGTLNRNQHIAYLAMGVLKKYQAQGIGTKLLQSGKEWAKKRGVIRLELTVMQQNLPAIRLYTKSGFVCEGVRKKSLKVNDQWVDELYMACFLDD